MYISQIVASGKEKNEKDLQQEESPEMGLSTLIEPQGNSGRRTAPTPRCVMVTVTLGQGLKKRDGKLMCPAFEGAYLIATNNPGKQRGLRMAMVVGKLSHIPC